jgi:Tol biopolymer transport system component
MRRLALALVLGGLAFAGSATGSESGSYSPPPGDQAPVWSPDGTAIVYLSKREPAGYHVMRPDGSGDRRLPLPPPGLFEPPTFVFSPGWFWIGFGGQELVVSRPDGSGRQRLSDTVWGSPPAWAPDGRRLAFARSDGIYVIDVDGSDLRRLTPRGGARPAWSPDGELIAFTGGMPGEPDILAIRPDGSGETVVSARLEGSHYDAVWSPDGTRLAFFSGLRRSWHVTVVARDGRIVAQIAPTVSPASLAWAPDGRRLLLSGWGVWIVDVETGVRSLLSPFGAQAVWSPDGREVAFAAGGECKDRSAIYRMRVDGGRPQRLTDDCRIRGTARADRLRGTGLADILLGLGGNDRLMANSAAYVGDDLYGGTGADALTGDARTELLDGGPGRDRLVARAGPDVLRGGSGRDVLLGEGGRDQLFAEDGERDVVSCGRNRLRRTGAELDVAFVDKRDAVAADCELLYRAGRLAIRAGRTALTIRTNGGGEGERDAVRTLRCNPAGGTVPRAAAACRRLAAMRGPFAPVPYDRRCALLADEAGAHVSGMLAGRRIVVAFRRYNTCELARWNRHRFLLEPR